MRDYLHTQKNKKTYYIVITIVSSLILCIFLSTLPKLNTNMAYADPKAEADAVAREIQAKQAELDSTSDTYTSALREFNEAQSNVNEAKAKIETANNTIAKTQTSLSTKMVDMYKNKTSTQILDLFLNIQSFDDFFKA